MTPARQAALEALLAIDRDDAFTALALDEALEAAPLEARDRALATELVYGVTRYRNTLDWMLGQVSHRPLEDTPPAVRNALRMAAYQLFYLTRVPAAAAVHQAVELAGRAGHRGTGAFVNGVLRQLQRRRENLPWPRREEDLVGYLSLAHAHPRWLVERWVRRFGAEEAEALLRANNSPAPTVLRANRLRCDVPGLIGRLAEESVAARRGRLAPEAVVLEAGASLGRLSAYRDGWFQPQDEGAMLVAPVVGPAPGQRLIDACAAPGGKATHLAELMDDQGQVVAVDVRPFRVNLVRQAARRLGLRSVRAVLGDARRLAEEYAGRADGVLVDAPCSGLGVLRRRPDAKWRKRESDIAGLADLQLEILLGAGACVRAGGTLVYSTCTTEPEENQAVVERFLAAAPGFRLADPGPRLPPPLRAEAARHGGLVQLYPHRHGTDGVFVARLEKVEHQL